MRKAVLILLLGIFFLQAFGGLSEAAEKTVQINIEGCWT